MKYVFGLIALGFASTAFAGNACHAVATPVAVPVQTVAVPLQHVQTVAVAQPVYVQRVAVAAQPVYVQQVAVAQHQQFVAVQKGQVAQRQFRGNGRVGNGGAFGNVLNSIFSPRGILTIGGAAAGAAIAGPAGAIGGSAIGAALGTVLSDGLGR